MNRLLHGDCLELMKDIQDGSINLTVTSPPYDNLRTYNDPLFSWDVESSKKLIAELYRVTKEGGAVVWVAADAYKNGSESGTCFRVALYAIDCGFKLNDTMIWRKPTFNAVGNLQSRYADVFEYMFIFSKGKPVFNPIKDRENKRFGATIRITKKRKRDGSMGMPRKNKEFITLEKFGIRHNIWDIPSVMSLKERSGHPAQFPIRLAEDHIISWSNEGDTVLDPLMGSGSTGVACINTGRHFIGIEKDDGYFEIAKKRIAEAEVKINE